MHNTTAGCYARCHAGRMLCMTSFPNVIYGVMHDTITEVMQTTIA